MKKDNFALEMKTRRIYVFIVIASIALLSVLIIQVNWIFATAKIKEDLFNEKANMVLSRTNDALSADKETYNEIATCVQNDSTTQTTTRLGNNEVRKIDSLFNYYLNYYNFKIDYKFVVAKPNVVGFNNGGSFEKSLKPKDSKNKAFELKLIFPDKKKFIIAEMGTMFITSVLLIFIVLFLFWLTVKSLIREKTIAEHTTDFLNNMTHEFKTPLTNISLAVKMIHREASVKNEEKMLHYSSIIFDENEKLKHQVEQVLSMTALEKGEIPLQQELIDFHDLINDSIKYLSLQIENKECNINVQLAAEKSIISGDKLHLRNTISNLIDNAIKYSPIKPELNIMTSNAGNSFIFKISDNGIGIKKEFQQKVFDKFFRVPTGDLHNVKGFGLGLAYIKNIVEMHNGAIHLESEINEGTAFIISLPNA